MGDFCVDGCSGYNNDFDGVDTSSPHSSSRSSSSPTGYGNASAGELGIGNPGSYGGRNTTQSMRDEFTGAGYRDNPYDYDPDKERHTERNNRVNGVQDFIKKAYDYTDTTKTTFQRLQDFFSGLSSEWDRATQECKNKAFDDSQNAETPEEHELAKHRYNNCGKY